MQPVANLSSKGSWHVIKKWQVAYISEHLAPPAHTCRAISQGASGATQGTGKTVHGRAHGTGDRLLAFLFPACSSPVRLARLLTRQIEFTV